MATALLAAGVALGLFAARRVRILSLPFLLLFGLGLGDAGVGLLASGPFLEQATELGLVLMLFYTSLASSPALLRRGIGVGLPLAAYDLILNFAVAWWIGSYFDWDVRERLFLTGILATSSTAVVMKVLGDEDRISKREGSVLASMLMVEDWVFLAFFAFLGFQYGGATSRDPGAIFVGLCTFAAFLLVLRLGRAWIWRIAHRELVIALLTSIALMGAYLGSLGGLPSVGSAFTVGLALAGPHAAEFVRREAPFLREAASALFFVGYGAQLGPALVPSVLPLVGLSILGILTTELLFIPVLAHRLGLTRAESLVTGSLLLPRGGKSAAFARLYPASAVVPLFALSGLLAIVLTPLTPILVRLTVRRRRRRIGSGFDRPDEAFSRWARSMLMPHRFRQRLPSGALERIVLAQLLFLVGLLALLTVLVPWPVRLGPLLLCLGTLPLVFLALRDLVRRGPGSPYSTHPQRVPVERRGVVDHLPLVLVGPLGLLLLLALASPWTLVVYPAIFALVFGVVLALPWLQRRSPRAPPLAQLFPA